MKLMYNIMFFALLVSLSAWLVDTFALVPTTLPAEYTPDSIMSMFSLNLFQNNFMYVGVGVAAGLAGLLLRQNTFALYALVIFGVASFLPILSNIIYALPRMIDTIMVMYPEYNPFANAGMLSGTNPYSLFLAAIAGFAAWIFIMDMISGRQTA
jgi:hypothetical protein